MKQTTLHLILALLLSGGCRQMNEKSGNFHKPDQSIPFDFPYLQPPVFRDQTFDIREYGARSDDTTFLNTEAIRSAIIACNKAGGGKVLVPSGIWLTGTVHLLIQRGGVFCYNYSPLVYARNCENIAVTGPGLLNGKAIDFNLLYDSEPIETAMKYQAGSNSLNDAPVFRNFHIENITCSKAKKAINLAGLPGGYLKEIYFRDVNIVSREGLSGSNVNDVCFVDVRISQ